MEEDRGTCPADPETRLLDLHHRWNSAGEDFARRDAVVRDSATWLAEELGECVRLGRSFLRSLPVPYREALDTGADLVDPYREFFELYAWHVEECLRRALAMAYRCREGMGIGLELSAAIPIAEAHYRFASSVLSGYPTHAVESGIGRLQAAESVVSEAFHAEYAQPPTLGTEAPRANEGADQAPTVGTGSPPRADSLGYEEKAVAAAYAIQKRGGRVSVNAVCKEAGLNRSHLIKRYPDAVKLVNQIGSADRSPRRGSKGRDGSIEAIDE